MNDNERTMSYNIMRSHLVCFLLLVWLQNNNLERALDWIFTHPDCEDESEAMSDTTDTELNNNSFSNANAHSDSSLSPDQDLSSPRVRDGPGRKCLPNTELNKQRSTHTEDNTVCIHCWIDIPLLILLFFSSSKVTNCLLSSVTWDHPQCLVIMCAI